MRLPHFNRFGPIERMAMDGSWLASVLRQFRGPLVLNGRVRR
jgi:hypothetical protein